MYTLDEYPLPTPTQLNRHVHLYGREGTDGMRSIVARPEGTDELAVKAAEANVKEQARKRTARRTGIKEQARVLLAHSPELNYMALADALNIGDRRAKGQGPPRGVGYLGLEVNPKLYSESKGERKARDKPYGDSPHGATILVLDTLKRTKNPA